MRKFLLLCFLCFLPFLLWTQETTDVALLLESMGLEYGESEYEELVTVLQRLQSEPLNLNTVPFDSLKLLFFLSDNQIDCVLDFRKRHGGFKHLNELLLAGAFTTTDIEYLKPFVVLGETHAVERKETVKKAIKQELITKGKLTFPLQEGYKKYELSDFKSEAAYRKKQNSRFRGGPVGVLVKYKMQMNKRLQAGFTLENDPGEAYFTRYQRTGFDFLSAHLNVETERLIRRLVVGDYKMQWGQGLVMWNGFGSGKSSLVLGNEKSAKGALPYTSTDENAFLRGVALGLRLRQELTADLFFSYKKTDGNIHALTDTLSEEDLLTSSLYASGYHRNQNECEKKYRLKELTTGMALRWNTARFNLGIHAVYYDFTPPLEVGDEPYKQHNDNGRNRLLAAVDYKTGFQHIYFFGETAVDEKGNLATVNGLRFSGGRSVALSVLYRRYDKRYTSYYASGFGEYSNTSNEEGFYMGVTANPVKNLKISGYYDYFRFFGSRYNAFLPGSGSEVLLDVSYSHKKTEYILRFKGEYKPEDYKQETIQSVQRKKNQFWIQFRFQPLRYWEFRSCMDVVFYRKAESKENGFLVYQDVIRTAKKDVFKMQLRLAYFRTDSYASRMYAYENNVLYGYSFPAYYDKGFRTYLNLKVKLKSYLTLYWKGGFTCYPDRESMGSYLSEISGNKVADVVLQLRAVF